MATGLRVLDARMSGLVIAPLLIFACFQLLPAAGFPPDQFPVAAYSHLGRWRTALCPGQVRRLSDLSFKRAKKGVF